ncbi:Cingulin [Lasiodiplodia hormozganensis]|uniref:Cingulin n=1 Tax=Lasiodiplodia hormozganensis TaxID=869390 RepID=A0AA39X1R1_9PEZI|nr:Cingulin [Lasiodiplodia hormozganensis]
MGTNLAKPSDPTTGQHRAPMSSTSILLPSKMAGNEIDESAKHLISTVINNAISSKGSAYNSPEHGPTIMTKQAAELMKNTRNGNPCPKRLHSALWAADGPIPPDGGFDNLDLRIQKICAIETHLNTCFATVLASDFLSVQEALCMPIELLSAIELFFKSWNLVSLDRFQELARRKLDDTKSSSLAKPIIIAMEKDLADGMLFSFKKRPVKFSSSRIPASCAASSDDADVDATINSTSKPTPMPDTPTPMPKTTAAAASAPPNDAAPNGKAATTTSDPTTTTNSGSFVAARLPSFATPAKRNLSPNATPPPQRHGRQPSVSSTPLAQASETINRVLASADAEHQRELNAAKEECMDAKVELDGVKAEHKREVEALQAEHRRELEAAEDRRMAVEVEIGDVKVEHLRELEAREAEHERKLEEQRDEQRQQWEGEKSELVGKKDEAEEDLGLLVEKYKALETQFDELERRNDALGKWARDLETDMELSEPKIRELEKSKASLEKEVSDLRNESKAQKNDFEKTCAALEDGKKMLASNVDKLEDEKKEMQKKIDEFARDKTSMENTISGLQADKEKLQTDLDKIREQVSTASRQYAALHATLINSLNDATALDGCLLRGLDDKDPSTK